MSLNFSKERVSALDLAKAPDGRQRLRIVWGEPGAETTVQWLGRLETSVQAGPDGSIFFELVMKAEQAEAPYGTVTMVRPELVAAWQKWDSGAMGIM